MWQEALSPPDQCIQEFRDWAKNLYRNFAMTRGSSPEEFLDLVKRQDYKLIQVFKKLLRTEDTADSREEMTQVKFTINEFERIKLFVHMFDFCSEPKCESILLARLLLPQVRQHWSREKCEDNWHHSRGCRPLCVQPRPDWPEQSRPEESGVERMRQE